MTFHCLSVKCPELMNDRMRIVGTRRLEKTAFYLQTSLRMEHHYADEKEDDATESIHILPEGEK